MCEIPRRKKHATAHFADGADGSQVSVTVCTSDEYKSVTSCNHDGSSSSCTTTTGRLKDEEDSDENLRGLCTSGMNVDCDELATRVDRKKKGSICDLGRL